MLDKKFTMDLAKLLIAAAWADGKLQKEEENSLKDLIFTLGDINSEQWVELEIYMDSAVNAEETQILLGRVLENIKTHQDKQLVIATLRKLFEADGVVGDEEENLLEEFEEAVMSVSTTLTAGLTKMLKSCINKRSDVYHHGIQRGDRISKSFIYLR